jgi:hypothetical protein
MRAHVLRIIAVLNVADCIFAEWSLKLGDLPQQQTKT